MFQLDVWLRPRGLGYDSSTLKSRHILIFILMVRGVVKFNWLNSIQQSFSSLPLPYPSSSFFLVAAYEGLILGRSGLWGWVGLPLENSSLLTHVVNGIINFLILLFFPFYFLDFSRLTFLRVRRTYPLPPPATSLGNNIIFRKNTIADVFEFKYITMWKQRQLLLSF